MLDFTFVLWDRRGRDRMVIRFITPYAISTYYHKMCEFEPRLWRGVLDKHCVIKCVSDLLQVGGFLRVFRFFQPI